MLVVVKDLNTYLNGSNTKQIFCFLQVKNYTLELRSKESDLTSMRIELEDSNMKFMATDSVLTQCRGEMNKLQEKVREGGRDGEGWE